MAGEGIQAICHALQRTEPWLHTWWKRSLGMGPEGLYDLTRANRGVVNRTPPHIERAVISLRRRLAARATPPSRDTLVGAPQLRAELEALGSTPLPSLRAIERIIARAALSCPPLQRPRPLAKTESPGLKAQDTPQLHQVELVGPRYLKGDSTRDSFLVLRDAFDLSVYLALFDSRKLEGVMAFLVRAWQQLGLPQQVPCDNGRECCGFGPSATGWSSSSTGSSNPGGSTDPLADQSTYVESRDAS